jgi:hypothetical protein
MTPQQKIKWLILEKARSWTEVGAPEPPKITADNVDAIYDEQEGDEYGLQDARNEVRCGGTETKLPGPSSRHYESEEVAAQCPDGSWVGWTHWYGGGKHGDPEEMEWIPDAYDLTVTEKEVTITQRTFAKVDPK